MSGLVFTISSGVRLLIIVSSVDRSVTEVRLELNRPVTVFRSSDDKSFIKRSATPGIYNWVAMSFMAFTTLAASVRLSSRTKSLSPLIFEIA